ncbi:MAG: hypothetical protein Q4A37_00870 [Candidatus Saccharibacteria bacterium]|nr:hypothetical protein [Candidatus Saccharibacteria bacterium]
MSELRSCAIPEQPIPNEILGRLEDIRRKTLIDNGPEKPATIKLVATTDLESLLVETQTILEVLIDSRPTISSDELAGESQHQQRMRTSHHMLALHVIEKIRLELCERRSTAEALARVSARTLVI